MIGQLKTLFEETAKNEQEHAKIWFKLLHDGDILNEYFTKTLENIPTQGATNEEIMKFMQSLSEDEIKQNITLICPLGEKNLDFWEELSKKEKFTQKNILIPGFTRECCTLIERELGRVTELVVEEPKIQDENQKDKTQELLSLLECELAKKSPNKPDALLVAGSVPNYWDTNIMGEIAKIAKNNDVLLMAYFKGKTLSNLIPAFIQNIIKINKEEFLETF